MATFDLWWNQVFYQPTPHTCSLWNALIGDRIFLMDCEKNSAYSKIWRWNFLLLIVLEQIYVAFIWMLFNSNSTSNLSNINEHARNKRILQDYWLVRLEKNCKVNPWWGYLPRNLHNQNIFFFQVIIPPGHRSALPSIPNFNPSLQGKLPFSLQTLSHDLNNKHVDDDVDKEQTDPLNR